MEVPESLPHPPGLSIAYSVVVFVGRPVSCFHLSSVGCGPWEEIYACQSCCCSKGKVPQTVQGLMEPWVLQGYLVVPA